MPSAFISYAHEDQEFVLALVPHLEAQGLSIEYDRVVLRIGDSLIRAISARIAEGDFLIAVVSPDSVASEWCQQELAQAKTEGIEQRQVKVLPIKYRDAAMPPFLRDTFYGDADSFDPETLARQLAAAMTAHLEGREAEAAQEAQAVEDTGRAPAHAEVAGDATVAQLDGVAEEVWAVLGLWEGIFGADVNLRELVAEQRQLRWAFDNLPERVQVGLPLTRQMAESSWDDFFAGTEVAEVEPDVREELRSVRTQLAQGLPVTRRWLIDEDFGQVSAGRRDATAFLWGIKRGEDTRRVTVYISGTAMAIEDDQLLSEVAQAKETSGRSVVSTLLALDDPPAEVSVTTSGISLTMPD